MTAPLIGITTYRTTNAAHNPLMAISAQYVRAVSQAGGIPVLIPLGLPQEQIRALSARLDGILFSGGGDIDPALFGVKTHPKVGDIQADRDILEIQMVREAVSAGVPFLGICRGLQVINVALGGTLYTHIADQHPQAIEHTYYPDWPRDHLAHTVRFEPGSHIAAICGPDEISVNSLHHQGVQVLASGLRATGHSPDGLIETLELSAHPFGLAVQWHPEWLTAHAPQRALFRAFVEAAAQ